MKINLKVLSLLVVLMMLLSAVLSGCGQETKNGDTSTPQGTTAQNTTAAQSTTVDPDKVITYEGEVTGSLPVTDKDITLTYWCPFKPDAAKVMDSFAEIPMFQEYQKRTGVKLKFVHPAIGQEKESFQLMVASQSFADIIEFSDGGLSLDLYPGGPDKAIQDNAFLRLNDLIDKYAPNYQRIMKSKPEIEKGLKSDTGNIFAFQMIEKTVQPAYGGPAVRTDWLKDLNLAIPVTFDDWYNMLKAFRDQKGAKAPLLIDKEGGTDCYFSFIGSFGVTHEFSRVGNKVIYGPIEPDFKAYVTLMNKWYSEKLVDQDFISGDDCSGPNTIRKIATGETGAFYSGFYHFVKYEKAALEEDPNFKIEGVPHPVINKGDKVTIRQYNEHTRGRWTFISGSNKYPEETVKMINYNYSDQGTMLFNYGIEGKDYNLVNGKVVYSDAIINNPIFPNTIKSVLFAKEEGPFIRNYERGMEFEGKNALDAMNIVWKGDNSGMLPYTLSMTADEGTKFNNTMNDINMLVSEMLPKFIMGVEPLSAFDAFVEQIKKMGINDAIVIKQACLDRYNAR